MAKWCEVECREVQAARREDWNRETPSVSVRLMCEDLNKFAAIQDLMLYHRPYPFNKAAVKPYLFADSISTNPDKARYGAWPNGQVIDYWYDTYFDVIYKDLGGSALYYGDRVVLANQDGIMQATETWDPEVDFITFDYRKFFWKNTTPREQWDRGQEGGFRMVKNVIQREVKGYFKIPASINSWEGTTNNQAFTSDILGMTFDVDTLLITDIEVVRGPYNWFYSDYTFSISAKLTWRPDGWTKFPHLVCDGTAARIEMEEVEVQCEKMQSTKKDWVPFRSWNLQEFLFTNDYYPGCLFNPNDYITWTM